MLSLLVVYLGEQAKAGWFFLVVVLLGSSIGKCVLLLWGYFAKVVNRIFFCLHVLLGLNPVNMWVYDCYVNAPCTRSLRSVRIIMVGDVQVEDRKIAKCECTPHLMISTLDGESDA
jgi:hypothetical protein